MNLKTLIVTLILGTSTIAAARPSWRQDRIEARERRMDREERRERFERMRERERIERYERMREAERMRERMDRERMRERIERERYERAQLRRDRRWGR